MCGGCVCVCRYLPPECLQQSSTVSNKVDIWSMGVIFYQMLFGKRPFGHDKRQDELALDAGATLMTDLVIPDDPPVTEKAKAFLRACLDKNVETRPSVVGLLAHDYIRWKKFPTVKRS
jgi:tousled-like kinase